MNCHRAPYTLKCTLLLLLLPLFISYSSLFLFLLPLSSCSSFSAGCWLWCSSGSAPLGCCVHLLRWFMETFLWMTVQEQTDVSVLRICPKAVSLPGDTLHFNGVLVHAVGFKKLICTFQREAMYPSPCTSLPSCPSTLLKTPSWLTQALMMKWVWHLVEISKLPGTCHWPSTVICFLLLFIHPVVRMGRRGSCRAGPCVPHAVASHTSNPVWVTRCPAATPATPATAASSTPSVIAAGLATPACLDATSYALLGSWTTPLLLCAV